MRAFGGRMLNANSGNALVLAVLILLSLTSVGLVSVQRTNTDLLVAGNVARSTQAFLGSDAGMRHGLMVVGPTPQLYVSAVTMERTLGGTAANNDLSFPVVDSTTAAAAIPLANVQTPLTENLWMSAVDNNIELARIQQDVAFRVTSIWVNELKGLAGNSLDVDICHEVYDFNALGGIPTRIESVDQTMQQTDTVVVNSRARALTGPIQCTKK